MKKTEKINLYLKVLKIAISNFFKYIKEGKINKLTLSNIKGYFQGIYRMEKFMNSTNSLDFWTEEQFYYRMTKVRDNCFLNKMCPCECEIPQKQLEDRSCDLECYPPMMNKDQWELFKQENSLNMIQVKRDGLSNILKTYFK